MEFRVLFALACATTSPRQSTKKHIHFGIVCVCVISVVDRIIWFGVYIVYSFYFAYFVQTGGDMGTPYPEQ